MILLRGDNRPIDKPEEFLEIITRSKSYNPECGSALYLTKNIESAKYYAIKSARKYGGTPTISRYILNLDLIKDELKTIIFDTVTEESLLYIGKNLEGIFPEDCKIKHDGLLPKELCHNCHIKECKWNYDYIESILSECGESDYNLDFIFKDFINGVITEKEAQDKINSILPNGIKIQYALRKRALDPRYFAFYDSYPIEMEDKEL